MFALRLSPRAGEGFLYEGDQYVESEVARHVLRLAARSRPVFWGDEVYLHPCSSMRSPSLRLGKPACHTRLGRCATRPRRMSCERRGQAGRPRAPTAPSCRRRSTSRCSSAAMRIGRSPVPFGWATAGRWGASPQRTPHRSSDTCAPRGHDPVQTPLLSWSPSRTSCSATTSSTRPSRRLLTTTSCYGKSSDEEGIVKGLLRSPEAIRSRVGAYLAAGVDHVVLYPTVAEVSQVHRLADVLGLA
jgi:hypothetical protein